MRLSVVSPVFNEEECVEEFCNRLFKTLVRLTPDFEIVLVDDGSVDSSWERIVQLSQKGMFVRGVRLSRNFGHHYAISAGLDHCDGDWVVVMDSDLQDLPETIPLLLDKAREGYDVVLARRQNRQFGWFKDFCARLFYRAFQSLTDGKYDGQAGVYCMLSRNVVGVFRQLSEVDRFFPALVVWIGFRRSHVDVTHGKRFAGQTKYPFRKQLALAINAILSFSDKPIVFAVYVGVTISVLSLIFTAYIVIRAIFGTIAVLGYASIISSIFFIGGVIIATLGSIGLYVGRIFRQVKGRPLYVVSDTCSAQHSESERSTAAWASSERTSQEDEKHWT